MLGWQPNSSLPYILHVVDPKLLFIRHIDSQLFLTSRILNNKIKTGTSFPCFKRYYLPKDQNRDILIDNLKLQVQENSYQLIMLTVTCPGATTSIRVNNLILLPRFYHV